jgi:hypothetical protein
VESALAVVVPVVVDPAAGLVVPVDAGLDTAGDDVAAAVAAGAATEEGEVAEVASLSITKSRVSRQ